MTGEVIFLFLLRQNRSNFQDNDVGSSSIGELPNFSSTFEGGKKENWNTPAVPEKKEYSAHIFLFFWDGMACVSFSFLRPSFASANLPPPPPFFSLSSLSHVFTGRWLQKHPFRGGGGCREGGVC